MLIGRESENSVPKPNAQYNVAEADSFVIKIASAARRRMYDDFCAQFQPSATCLVLDVGVTSDRTYDSSNYFEKYYPYKANITAVGIDDASFLEKDYPGLKYVRADGCDLPFDDNSYDFVHSSAVIEHVGSTERQAKFVRELLRVSKRGAFITTPNRWFPIEFHTVLPLLHWLPKRLFRGILQKIGYVFFAKEENLNLLGANQLLRLVPAADRAGASIRNIRLLGWRSNLLLVVKKQ